MRRLADRLGISAMTPYRYFATKDELLSALAQRRLRDLDPPSADLPWQEQVAAVFRATHRLFLEHPELAEIAARQHLNAVAADRTAEVVFGALRRAGLDAEQAVHAFHALTSFTVGFTLRRVHLGAQDQGDPRRVARLRALPPDEFEHFQELAAVYAGGLSDRQFDTGLDLLIRGISTMGTTT